MADDAAVLLRDARQEAGDVDQRHDRHVERVAEAQEARRLVRGVDVQGGGVDARLVGEQADGAAGQPGEADHDVLGELRLHLDERARVHRLRDHRAHVERPARVVGNQLGDARGGAVDRIGDRQQRRRLLVVERQVAQQAPQAGQALRLVREAEVRDAAGRRMRGRAAQVAVRDLLARHRPDDLRAGDVHVADRVDHENEVRDRRRVDRSARARPQDDRELRDHARGKGVGAEDLGVAVQRQDPLLDARAARVVDLDERHPGLQGEPLCVRDARGVHLPQGAAHHREVLRGHEHLAPLDLGAAGHHAVARHALPVHAEVRGAHRHERLLLDEGIGIHQRRDPLACRQLALGVLRRDALFTAAGLGLLALGPVRLQQAFLHAGERDGPEGTRSEAESTRGPSGGQTGGAAAPVSPRRMGPRLRRRVSSPA